MISKQSKQEQVMSSRTDRLVCQELEGTEDSQEEEEEEMIQEEEEEEAVPITGSQQEQEEEEAEEEEEEQIQRQPTKRLTEEKATDRGETTKDHPTLHSGGWMASSTLSAPSRRRCT